MTYPSYVESVDIQATEDETYLVTLVSDDGVEVQAEADSEEDAIDEALYMLSVEIANKGHITEVLNQFAATLNPSLGVKVGVRVMFDWIAMYAKYQNQYFSTCYTGAASLPEDAYTLIHEEVHGHIMHEMLNKLMVKFD